MNKKLSSSKGQPTGCQRCLPKIKMLSSKTIFSRYSCLCPSLFHYTEQTLTDEMIYVKMRNSLGGRIQCQDHFALSEVAPAISPDRADSSVCEQKAEKLVGSAVLELWMRH